MHREDRDLPDDKLREKRCRWLERHDQHTSHIGSQLPLVQGLPVRLTDAVDRKRALFRGRRGTIVGWVPHSEKEREEMDGDWILSHMPEIIYVHFPGATWTIHENLKPGVYPLTPVSRTWEVDKRTKIKARRTGFFAVPDFASTAHMIQGQSLEAAFADVVHTEFNEKPTEELHVAGYVMLSRAKYLSKIWIMQAFSRDLFAQGPPPAPHILLRKLRGEIAVSDVAGEFAKVLKKEVPKDKKKGIDPNS